MSKIEPSVIDRLAKIAAELSDVVGMIRGPQPIFPSSSADLVAQRICLVGNHHVPDGERYVRGNCGKHGQQVRDAVTAGDTTEFELISEGLLAPEVPSGRKPAKRSKLHDLLDVKRRLRAESVPAVTSPSAIHSLAEHMIDKSLKRRQETKSKAKGKK